MEVEATCWRDLRGVGKRARFDILRVMIKIVKEALAVLRELSEEHQEVIARAILDLASQDREEIYRLSDDERELVQEGLASRVVSGC